MESNTDIKGMHDAAVSLLTFRLLHYAKQMIGNDEQAQAKAKRIVLRSVELGHKHQEDISKLLDESFECALLNTRGCNKPVRQGTIAHLMYELIVEIKEEQGLGDTNILNTA